MNPYRRKDLERLLQKLGLENWPAIDWSLLDLALTHPSAAAANYEQLEFIGDAVLRLAAALFLAETYPKLAVGELAAIRSVLVSDRTLADIGECYSLDRYILKSKAVATDPTGIAARQADALEALLAALYLSTHNFYLIRPWLDSHFRPLAEAVLQDPARQNYKAALQEWTQSHYQCLPDYQVTEINSTHDAPDRFKAVVYIQGKCYGQGIGRSIKVAEQAAAKEAFTVLQKSQLDE